MISVDGLALKTRIPAVMSAILALVIFGAFGVYLQKSDIQSRLRAIDREKSRLLTEFANVSRQRGDPVTAGLLRWKPYLMPK